MKSEGITRGLDALGRIVIPKECRKELGWSDNAKITICPFGQYILLKAQGDQKNSLTSPNNPIINDIAKELKQIVDSDLLLILEFVHRLAHNSNDLKDDE